MAERPWSPSDSELERALGQLGQQLDLPPTPDLASAVSRRLAQAPRRSRWRGWVAPPRLATALALLLLGLTAALTLWPDAREALAERIGLRGVTIEHLPFVPTAPNPPASSPLGTGLNLGQPLSIEAARAALGFSPLLPTLAELGEPDEVYVGEPPSGGQLSLVYHATPRLPPTPVGQVGLLLTQFRGSLEPGLLRKGIGPGTRIEELQVDGGRGAWLEGQPHLFMYRDRQGQIVDESVRLVGNVLLWERGDLTLRLESALSRDEALRIARSLR